jgi:hypothetical protein
MTRLKLLERQHVHHTALQHSANTKSSNGTVLDAMQLNYMCSCDTYGELGVVRRSFATLCMSQHTSRGRCGVDGAPQQDPSLGQNYPGTHSMQQLVQTQSYLDVAVGAWQVQLLQWLPHQTNSGHCCFVHCCKLISAAR